MSISFNTNVHQVYILSRRITVTVTALIGQSGQILWMLSNEICSICIFIIPAITPPPTTNTAPIILLYR